MATKITRDIIESYLNCKYKGHLKLTGEQGVRPDYEELMRRARDEVRLAATEKILARYPPERVLRSVPLTAAALQEGPLFVLDACLENDLVHLDFDGLKRVDGPSKLGDFHYAPVLFHEGRKVRKREKLLLELYGLILSRLQEKMPALGIIWHGKECRGARVHLRGDLPQAEAALQELNDWRGPAPGPRLILNQHCQVCEFRQRCHDQAVKEDNLSLLRGMTEKEIRANNQKGIFTVNQLSYTFRYRKPPKRAKRPSHPHYHSLQARAIRTRVVHVHGCPSLPTAEAKVYLDIEGVPDRDFHYLIGAVIEAGGSTTHNYFWADDESEQEAAFAQLAVLLGSLTNLRVYHFGSYEVAALESMRRRLGPLYEEAIRHILANAVNVLSVVHRHVYFPTYSNSLKDIGRALGHQWTDVAASGVQSIVWRDAWERGHDPGLKEKLIRYNKEDCLAVKALCDFLVRVERGRTAGEGQNEEAPGFTSTQDLPKPQRNWPHYGRQTFALADLERVNECAYFDYQRERVYVRTEKRFKRINKRAKLKRLPLTANKKVVIECGQCPFCGSQKVRRKHRLRRKTVDMKFFTGGVKKWVVQYVSWAYQCGECGGQFLSDRWPRDRSLYQPGLACWCVYQNIECKQNMYQVQETLVDVFRFYVPHRQLYVFKGWIAKRYESLYEEIKAALIRGHLLHVDEATVNLRNNEKGYVWVLASLDKVYYFYKPSREGTFLNEMLAGFAGVLVSDFFSTYESVDCPQQKCLLHLLRDVNDDLQKNPFDEEFKQFAQDFAGLLRGIVETADRHGLARAYLSKHKPRATTFLEDVASKTYSSEVMLRYQKRIRKNATRLFTFLDHDTVPWNNNNAEHAIKYFAKFRELADGTFSERSLKEALLLLSIFQTCRFNSVNVVRFLLSGETDIASIRGAEGGARS
jgi:predicted RecB family nuclease